MRGKNISDFISFLVIVNMYELFMTYVCDFCFVLNISVVVLTIRKYSNARILGFVNRYPGGGGSMGVRGAITATPDFAGIENRTDAESDNLLLLGCWPPRFLDLPPHLVHTY